MNLPPIQIQFKLPVQYFQSSHEQLSPINKKNVFHKAKKQLSPSGKQFNPHLQKLNTNYYVKSNQIIPYSYTVTQNPCFGQNLPSPTIKYLQEKKAKTFKSKILSLKEFSCIETVSQKSKHQNSEDSGSQINVSKTLGPKQIDSEISSPVDLKNFKSTFTIPNRTDLNLSQNIFKKSQQTQRIGQRWDKNQSAQNKIKRIGYSNYQIQNDRKTSKLTILRQNRNFKNCEIQKQVIEVRILPSQSSCLKSNSVQQSCIVFDYNKFYKKRINSPELGLNMSSSHPINGQIFRYFGEQKQKQSFLAISNQNDSYIDIVREINSPKSTSVYGNNKFSLNYSSKSIVYGFKNNFQRQVLRTELTQLVKQGPRSYSTGNSLKKLSGQKNNYVSSNKQSIVLKTQTRPTTGRSDYFNQFQLNTPKTPISYRNQHILINSQDSNNNSNKINFIEHEKKNVFDFLKIQENKSSMSKQVKNNDSPKKPKILATLSRRQQAYNQQQVQKSSGRKDSKRRSNKGITVSSKQKRESVQRNNFHPPMSSKIKSISQIKNMKKLRLSELQDKMQPSQPVSPIKYKNK